MAHSQVCRWLSMKPGMTTSPVTSITWASPVTKIKDVQQSEAHRSATARHAGELAHDVPGGDRLVDDVVCALKPAHAAQVDVGDRLQDAAVRLGHRLLASKWRARVGDVIPH